MRTFVSALAVILALLLTGFAVPAAWTERNIVREDGFVQLTDRLGKDPAFQARLAGIAVSNIEAGLELPAPAEELGASLLNDAAQHMSSWPEYPQAWNETVRRSHRLNFAGPAASSAGGSTQPGDPASGESAAETSLVLDLGPLVQLLGDKLRAATGVQLTVPDTAVVSLGGPSQRQAVDRVAAYAPMWWPAGIGAAMALALAVLTARRRSAVLVCAGIGLAVLAGVWQASAVLFGGLASAGLGESAMGSLFARELIASSIAGFAPWVAATALGGGAVFLAGVVGLVLRRRRSIRPAAR
ncbi:hypothetical protein [Arthrobacter celericrescens]|uniref:hypothetical protein n=1 Tax=Arthrobacter celericrescens TaxID=2320851 RepID=UPI0013C48FA8|nr:hypothetical protein [Arthrobacter celericrescens]